MGFTDVVYPMLAGLALRIVIDAATFHSVKLGGTLVGLWEGVVLLHYVKRAKSPDPAYLGYAARLLVDFYFTESVFRLVVVLLWTTVGMVVADVAPAVWTETGLKREWSRFGREVSRILLSRGSTSRASQVGDEDTDATPVIPIRTRPIKRPVPGTFPGAEWSETETRPGTVVEEEEDEDEEDYEDSDDEPFEEADIPVFPSQPSHLTIVPTIIPSSSEPSEPDEDSNTFSLTTPPQSPVSY
jgi:hypothetical protein